MFQVEKTKQIPSHEVFSLKKQTNFSPRALLSRNNNYLSAPPIKIVQASFQKPKDTQKTSKYPRQSPNHADISPALLERAKIAREKAQKNKLKLLSKFKEFEELLKAQTKEKFINSKDCPLLFLEIIRLFIEFLTFLVFFANFLTASRN